MKTLGTIEGCPIILCEDGSVDYIAMAAIDDDGSDNRRHDPCWQRQTSLSHNGHAIDAEAVPYVVVPPLILYSVPGIVLGCMATVTHTLTGQSTAAVVADIGPHLKIGEVSCECARRIGLSGDPNHGGEDRHVIHYVIHPGVPAVIDGITYKLQPAR